MNFDSICFVSADQPEAKKARVQLENKYGAAAPNEADIIVAVKDGDLEDMYEVPFEVVEEAYPDIQWGGRS